MSGAADWEQGPLLVPQTDSPETWPYESVKAVAIAQGAHALVRIPYNPRHTCGDLATIVVEGVIEAFEALGFSIVVPEGLRAPG